MRIRFVWSYLRIGKEETIPSIRFDPLTRCTDLQTQFCRQGRQISGTLRITGLNEVVTLHQPQMAQPDGRITPTKVSDNDPMNIDNAVHIGAELADKV